MKAAVVSSFTAPPRFAEIAEPVPAAHEILVDVLATGLHPRVRSQADGSHYTSTAELPLVPGVDGVGRDGDGLLRYFVLTDTLSGSMAQRTVIDPRRSIVLPADSDPVLIAAAMNPAMASWIALRRRVSFESGQNVLILGATGSAGQMAVQIAKRLGAAQIVAAGRDAARLAGLTALGATETVSLTGDAGEVADRLAACAPEVDVVIDFLWGQSTGTAMSALVARRPDSGRQLSWIEIGAAAGATAAIPAAALRSTRLQIVGSGQGSVSGREILAELPALVRAVSEGTFVVDARPVPLADVEQAWDDDLRTPERIVLTFEHPS